MSCCPNKPIINLFYDKLIVDNEERMKYDLFEN